MKDKAEQMLAQQIAEEREQDLSMLKEILFEEFIAPSGMTVVLRRLPVEMLETITSFYDYYGEAAKHAKALAEKLAEEQKQAAEESREVMFKPDESEKEIEEEEEEEKEKIESVSPEMAVMLTDIVKLVLPMVMVFPVIDKHISFKDISMNDGPAIFWRAMNFSNMAPDQLDQDTKTGEE